MKYTLPASGDARTTDYVGTVEVLDDRSLNALKDSVARHNRKLRDASRRLGRVVGTLLRVRIKPRGPRLYSSYHTLMSEATHYDIYQGEDTEAMHRMREELETGLTPGELRKRSKLKMELWRLEWAGLTRKRGQ